MKQAKQCFFEAFDMDKFCDKEFLIAILHTVLAKGNISLSDHRMWVESDTRTRISISTPGGETEEAAITNGRGQGSCPAALASSLNTGSAGDEMHDPTRQPNTKQKNGCCGH